MGAYSGEGRPGWRLCVSRVCPQTQGSGGRTGGAVPAKWLWEGGASVGGRGQTQRERCRGRWCRPPGGHRGALSTEDGGLAAA